MSESQQNEDLGKLLREYGAAKQMLGERAVLVRELSVMLSDLSVGLRVGSDNAIVNVAKAEDALTRLPEALSVDWLRGLIAGQADLAAKIEAYRARLKPYNVS